MTKAIKQIKDIVKKLPCLGIPDPKAFLIVKANVFDYGYGGILKQKVSEKSKEQVVRYYSGI